MFVIILLLLSNLLIQTQSGASTVVIDPNTFSFVTFTPESCTNGELLCMGSATAGNGYLSLTPEPQQSGNSSSSLSNTTNNVGRVLYPLPVNVWPAIISTTFTVRITPFSENSTGSGDGMALVFAQDNRPSPNASYGSYLGMFDQSTQGKHTILIYCMKYVVSKFSVSGHISPYVYWISQKEKIIRILMGDASNTHLMWPHIIPLRIVEEFHRKHSV